MSGAPLAAVLVVAWCAAGAWVGARVARRGAAWGSALVAACFWPLYVATLSADVGPLADTIGRRFHALRVALREAAIDEPPELRALEEAVRRSDATLAVVDRLMAAGPPSDALTEARGRVLAEVLSVLADVDALRVDVGLALLAGTTVRVEARLVGLQARVRAARQVAELGCAERRPA